MSLSTSNSRKIYFKITLTMVLGMALSMGIIRAYTAYVDARGQTALARVLTSLDAIPQITAEPDDLVLFFGSSMVGAGFSPRQFDAELAEKGIAVTSFNFGCGGLNPLFQDYYSRRLRDGFQKQDRKLKLALIEFNPFQATIVRRSRALNIEDSYLALLATQKELLDFTYQDLERGALLHNIRYFRGGISAEMITNYFSQGFQEPPTIKSVYTPNEEVIQRRRELSQEISKRFDQDYPNYDAAPWSYAWQGGGTIPEERSAETLRIVDEYYTVQQDPYFMDRARLRRIQTADIIDLHFDETLVASFIQIVKNFQQFSEQVEVMLLPRNTRWIQRPPEAIQRLNAMVDRIQTETGLVIRNYEDLDQITPDMFRDATHLNRYVGAVTFTKFLVEEYAPLLKP